MTVSVFEEMLEILKVSLRSLSDFSAPPQPTPAGAKKTQGRLNPPLSFEEYRAATKDSITFRRSLADF